MYKRFSEGDLKYLVATDRDVAQGQIIVVLMNLSYALRDTGGDRSRPFLTAHAASCPDFRHVCVACSGVIPTGQVGFPTLMPTAFSSNRKPFSLGVCNRTDRPFVRAHHAVRSRRSFKVGNIHMQVLSGSLRRSRKCGELHGAAVLNSKIHCYYPEFMQMQ